ncbi:colorectal mutant cancer protein-like isoform X2 [Planococcus citri]|uniref:colorectal mutant cancer protein-like isoform X2 n=1 Tax=Planococcus citri TaxID=170843 RepID=UPI0031F82642
MGDKEVEELSICSEETNSVCDEERTRKLFQACDTDGDGYIDSNDLESICRELNLENCIEGLMHELGADDDGKISFEKFLNRKHDCWEFDSGARDLSPEPSTLQRLIDTAGGSANTGNLLQLANKLHLAALASLRAEITELNTRLQSVTEERDILESALKKCQEKSENSVIQRYEEQITELHSVIVELNKKLDSQRTSVITEEEDVLSDTEYYQTNMTAQSIEKTKKEKAIDEKENELKQLQHHLNLQKECAIKKDTELRQTKMQLSSAYDQIEKLKNKLRESENRRLALTNSPELRRKVSYTNQVRSEASTPVLKVAERVRLPKMDRSVTGSEISNLGISHTEIAEHLVSGVQAECNIQELCRQDKKHLEIEAERLHSKLEHLRAQNNTLQITLHDSKENCERMYLLLGKYESNAIALKSYADTCDEIINHYDQLVALLHRQRGENPQITKEEKDLRTAIATLKKDNSTVRNTVVELESYHCNEYENRPKPSPYEAKKLDLEMAVLIQDLMEMRENNAELRATVYMLDRERETLELKIAALQSQLQAYVYVKTEEQFDGDKETKLQERLKEVAMTLEKVNKNADLRQKQSLELANQLKNTNCALMKTLERCKRKSQLRLRKLETEMITMMDKHAAQVKSLKQRIVFLEDLNKDKLSCKPRDVSGPIDVSGEFSKHNDLQKQSSA